MTSIRADKTTGGSRKQENESSLLRKEKK